MHRDIDVRSVETDAKGRKATKGLNSHWSQLGARRFNAAPKNFFSRLFAPVQPLVAGVQAGCEALR